MQNPLLSQPRSSSPPTIPLDDAQALLRSPFLLPVHLMAALSGCFTHTDPSQEPVDTKYIRMDLSDILQNITAHVLPPKTQPFHLGWSITVLLTYTVAICILDLTPSSRDSSFIVLFLDLLLINGFFLLTRASMSRLFIILHHYHNQLPRDSIHAALRWCCAYSTVSLALVPLNVAFDSLTPAAFVRSFLLSIHSAVAISLHLLCTDLARRHALIVEQRLLRPDLDGSEKMGLHWDFRNASVWVNRVTTGPVILIFVLVTATLIFALFRALVKGTPLSLTHVLSNLAPSYVIITTFLVSSARVTGVCNRMRTAAIDSFVHAAVTSQPNTSNHELVQYLTAVPTVGWSIGGFTISPDFALRALYSLFLATFTASQLTGAQPTL